MRIAAPAAPTGTQRQVLKVLANPEGRAFLEYHPSVFGFGSCRLVLFPSNLDQTVLGSTCLALQRYGWVEEIKEWSQTGVTYWRISEGGKEALR